MGGTRSSGGAGAGVGSPPQEQWVRSVPSFPPMSRPTIRALLSRYSDRVEEILDESPDGYFVNLKEGWSVDIGGAGSGNFDSLREAEDGIRHAVRLED